MKTCIIILVLGLIHLSANAQKTNLKQFDFLLGNWEMKTAKGKTTEDWIKSKDSLMGKSYQYNLNGKAVLQETVTIKKIKGVFYFSVTGAGNNDRVDFKLISTDNHQLVFENKAHDFPQRIVYQHKSKNELFAYIEGVINGKKTKIEFPYQRKANN